MGRTEVHIDEDMLVYRQLGFHVQIGKCARDFQLHTGG